MRRVLLIVWLIPALVSLGCGGDENADTPVAPSGDSDTAKNTSNTTGGRTGGTVLKKPSLPKDIFFFEAEEFDPKASTPAADGVKWEVKDDADAFGGKYITPVGANRKGVTELLYPLGEVTSFGGDWMLWMRVVFPKVGGEAADSFFWDLGNGKNWGGAKEVIAGHDVPNWGWEGFRMKDRPDKGKGNWFKLIERESDIKVDVINIRRDGEIPNDEEYEAYRKIVAELQQ